MTDDTRDRLKAKLRVNVAARKSPPRSRAPVSLVPCIHLGARVPGMPCGSPLLRCELHADITTRFAACSGAQRCCATCPDRTTEVL